jgi:hypothetical protein
MHFLGWAARLLGGLVILILVVAGLFLALQHTCSAEEATWTHKFLCDTTSGEFAVAIFTLLLGVFTFGLWLSTHKLAATALAQINLARDEFNSTNRPKIRIKHVALSSKISDGALVTANITLINEGRTDAIIKEFGIEFFVQQKGVQLPPVSKYKPAQRKLNLVLPSGVSASLDDQSDGTSIDGFQNLGIAGGDLNLYCTG